MPLYNYTFLAPLLPAYVDNGTRDLLTVRYAINGVGEFKLTLIGRPSAVEMIRSELIESNGQSTNEQALMESQLVEHMLSMLRLTMDQQIEYLWFGQDRMLLSTDGDGDRKPRMTTRVSPVSIANHERDLTNTGLLFERTVDYREMFKLLSDAKQPTLPLSYRYLSLYKVLEINFKVEKKWPDLAELLSGYEVEYRSLNISSRSLEKHIHEIRDLCAHIKLDNSSAVLGITGLNNEELATVERLFMLLKKIVFQYLTTKFPIKVDLTPVLRSAAASHVIEPELKSQLDLVYDNEQAAALEQQAAHWEHEARARNRPKVISDAFIECSRRARKLAGLLKVSGGLT